MVLRCMTCDAFLFFVSADCCLLSRGCGLLVVGRCSSGVAVCLLCCVCSCVLDVFFFFSFFAVVLLLCGVVDGCCCPLVVVICSSMFGVRRLTLDV